MRQKGFTPIIILLVVVILGAVGYFGYTKGYFNSVLPKPSPTSEPTVPPTSLPPFTPPSDWKAYTNNKYGFGFKYPPNLKYITEDAEHKDTDVLQSYNFLDGVDNGIGDIARKQDLEILIEKYTGVCDSKINISIENRNKGRKDIMTESTTMLDGNSAITLESIDEALEGKLFYKIIYFCKNNYFYTIYWADKNIDVDRNILINQILSTFKFTQ